MARSMANGVREFSARRPATDLGDNAFTGNVFTGNALNTNALNTDAVFGITFDVDHEAHANQTADSSVSCPLPADLTAVREARTVVQQVLTTWQAEEIFDDVALVASELVANAVRHGLEQSAGADVEHAGIQLSLVNTGKHMICAVSDPSDSPPVRQLADPYAGSGRGLQLVESLSLCWGWTLLDGEPETAAGQGKSVWAIFPLGNQRQARSAVGAA